jgi:hypothetical protein
MYPYEKPSDDCTGFGHDESCNNSVEPGVYLSGSPAWVVRLLPLLEFKAQHTDILWFHNLRLSYIFPKAQGHINDHAGMIWTHAFAGACIHVNTTSTHPYIDQPY